MLPFRELDCPELKQIQCEVMDYINTHKMMWNGFWNKIDSRDFLRHNQTVFKYCYDLGYVINEVALLVADEQTPPPTVHVDEAPLVAKFNFPILNTSGFITQWYDIPKDVIESLPPILSPFGGSVYDFSKLEPYPVLDETNMNVPVVFNSAMPHAVVATSSITYPRIVLACMSSNQPIEFLRPQHI